MKKNKQKGFTLIELLVVVAIIGILAAVGVVAYSGYTAGAKKQAAKSNHSAVAKYVAAELQKCNLGESTAMSGNLTCKGNTSVKTVTAAVKALADFKNPYSTSDKAVVGAGTFVLGATNLQGVGSANQEVIVRTCLADSCTDNANQLDTRVAVE
mgnify:CR=1 FL=1